MQDYNSYDLFVKNPRIHTNFPFLALDCNNKKTIPPRMRFQEMHWHEDIQITYVLEGVIKIISLGKTIEVRQGEAVFISKRVLHQFIEVETAHYRSFLFPESFINFYEHSPMEKEIEQMNIGICLLKQKEIIDIIKNINHVSFEFYQEKHKEYYLATQLVQFMYYLLLQADHEENTLQDYHHSLQKCLAFIHLHYQENISLEEIAAYGNMSVGHCGRLFMQVLQTTPYEYLINYRIKKSLELLGKEKKTISQIALEVGFNDVSHFIQSFKKRMNITPKQYQKQLFNQHQNNIQDI